MQLWVFVGASFAGAILGAVMQYVLGQRSERRKNIQLRRTEAYVDLVKTVAALSRVVDEPSTRQLHATYADARARIAIYGSPDVVTELVAYLRSAGATPKDRSAHMARVVSAMRADGLGAKAILPAGTIDALLFAGD